MKRLIYLLILMLSFTGLSAQELIDVSEQTLKVSGLSEEFMFFGFAEGDKLIFNFEEEKGKELKEVEIIEHPGTSKFMDYKTQKIENKTFNINNSGIYKFRFYNGAIVGRICKIKIQRIPGNETTKKFNTSVYWRTAFDTTYKTDEERYLVKSDTSVLNFFSSTPQVSSQNALNGNKNRQVIDFVLPVNTISWSFYIGTGKEGKEAYDKANDDFNGKAASTLLKIPGYGPMAALALTGISYINKVQGSDNVKYWFLSDENSVALFQSNQTFQQYKKGDIVNEASQMKYPLKGKVHLALLNDNTFDPILVTVKATAIVVNQQWGTRPLKKTIVTSREEAYLKN